MTKPDEQLMDDALSAPQGAVGGSKVRRATARVVIKKIEKARSVLTVKGQQQLSDAVDAVPVFLAALQLAIREAANFNLEGSDYDWVEDALLAIEKRMAMPTGR